MAHGIFFSAQIGRTHGAASPSTSSLVVSHRGTNADFVTAATDLQLPVVYTALHKGYVPACDRYTSNFKMICDDSDNAGKQAPVCTVVDLPFVMSRMYTNTARTVISEACSTGDSDLLDVKSRPAPADRGEYASFIQF